MRMTLSVQTPDELIATGELGRQKEIRVLDIGAGLGATTWGVARALEIVFGRQSSRDLAAFALSSDSASLRRGIVRA